MAQRRDALRALIGASLAGAAGGAAWSADSAPPRSPAGAASAVRPGAGAAFGSFERPFAADSLWNSRPREPQLGDYLLPPTRYQAFVGPGAYSSGIFLARDSDPPVTVFGLSNPAGVWCPDDGASHPVRIAHWPGGVVSASGSDGHADIVDAAGGIVHSFWQLRRQGGRWLAEQYAWSALNGRGFGDPAHNHQGARAAGVATLGGMIRKAEIDDGADHYAHTLALSLDGSALQSGYVFPATAQDNNAPQRYRGRIAMGSLLMLPPDFDSAALGTAALRKVARTLQLFGARVVDQNEDTRYYIYVENGADFDLHRRRWNSTAGADLARIGDALRPMIGNADWIDGNGRRFEPVRKLNLLSLRGPWHCADGPAPRFDSWTQSLRFEAGGRRLLAVQRSEQAQRYTSWAPWRRGAEFQLQVAASGGARLRLRLVDGADNTGWDSGELGDGARLRFRMPQADLRPALSATSGSDNGEGTLKVSLIEQ